MTPRRYVWPARLALLLPKETHDGGGARGQSFVSAIAAWRITRCDLQHAHSTRLALSRQACRDVIYLFLSLFLVCFLPCLVSPFSLLFVGAAPTWAR